MTDTNTGDWNSGNRNSGNRNSGDWNSGDWNSGHRNSGNLNSGNRNSGNLNSGHRNSGDWNIGDLNSGHWNIGDWNSGDRNSGHFNSNTPDTIRVFNKECNHKDWKNAEKPSFIYDPTPETWVYESDMTDNEKLDNPTFHTCGGYLRHNDLADEWRKAYDNATPEDIEKLKALPNFDAKVFEEITGIDVNADTTTCEGKVVEIDGVEYVLTRK